MHCLFAAFLAFLVCLRGEAPRSFQSSYDQWKDRSHHFVEYLDDEDAARVIYIGSEAFAQGGKGARPTTSEGMGYGLLLAVAYEDQELFDKFLRFVLATAEKGSNRFLMPWMVNERCSPFGFKTSPASSETYDTSSSATDADMQIAWALHLADKKVRLGQWIPQSFERGERTWTYAELFAEMALEIRRCDVDLDLCCYTPGSSWHLVAKELIYPGYVTPFAFLALDSAPLPDLSSEWSEGSHRPENSLQLLVKNHTLSTIVVDYLGGNGSVNVDAEFTPLSSGQYTIAPLTSACARFTSPNAYYANATCRLTSANACSEYYFEYKNGSWSLQDQGSAEGSRVCLRGNRAQLCLEAEEIGSILFRFEEVLERSVQRVAEWQRVHCLPPNVLYYDGHIPQDGWSESYGFDASRFALWVGGYLLESEDPLLRRVLEILVEAAAPFVREGCLPDGGVNVLAERPMGSWTHSLPALNGPLYVAALAVGNEALARELEGPLFAYRIVEHQPSESDLPGDSGPYFNAALLLLTRAVVEGRLAL